jgi:hypothetical protein
VVTRGSTSPFEVQEVQLKIRYVLVTAGIVSPDPNYGVSPNPSRVGPSNSSTNPTGNELQGENGGGK